MPIVPGENQASEQINNLVPSEQLYTYIMARTSCLSWGDNDEYDHPDKGKTLNTLFLISFLWYYNIYIDGFDKVGIYQSI